jgi:hypothetical protein
MTFLAFMGWGTVYFAHASAAIQQQLREEVVQLRAAQDQLTAERDRAQAQLAVALPEVIALTKRPEDLEAKAPVTGSVSPPIPAGKPPRTPAKTLKPKARVDRPPLPVQAPELSCHTRGTTHRR